MATLQAAGSMSLVVKYSSTTSDSKFFFGANPAITAGKSMYVTLGNDQISSNKSVNRRA